MKLGIYFKVTGWSIRTAVQIVRSRARKARKAAQNGATGRGMRKKGPSDQARNRTNRKKSIRFRQKSRNQSREDIFWDFRNSGQFSRESILRSYLSCAFSARILQ